MPCGPIVRIGTELPLFAPAANSGFPPLVKYVISAQTCLSPAGRNAAIAARIADIRDMRITESWPNRHNADRPAFFT